MARAGTALWKMGIPDAALHINISHAERERRFSQLLIAARSFRELREENSAPKPRGDTLTRQVGQGR